MRRLLPFPLLWLSLLAMWVLLVGNLSAAQLLLGALVAGAATWAVVPLEPPKPRIRRIGAIVRLAGVVLADIVLSNLAVMRLIASGRPPRSAFVTIPLDLKDPNGLAVLACIVTATPGSAWIQHDSLLANVTIHVLDTPDEAAWGAALKHNYERRLLEIFR
jgi:multicomponent K+:H+ antiporter subunit E